MRERILLPSIKYRPGYSLKDIERWWIKKAYRHFQGNVLATSKALKISRATLYRKIGNGEDAATQH